MEIGDCISFREQALIFAGVIVMIVQAVLNYTERRYYRDRIARYVYAPPPLPKEETSLYDHGGGEDL